MFGALQIKLNIYFVSHSEDKNNFLLYPIGRPVYMTCLYEEGCYCPAVYTLHLFTSVIIEQGVDLHRTPKHRLQLLSLATH